MAASPAPCPSSPTVDYTLLPWRRLTLPSSCEPSTAVVTNSGEYLVREGVSYCLYDATGLAYPLTLPPALAAAVGADLLIRGPQFFLLTTSQILVYSLDHEHAHQVTLANSSDSSTETVSPTGVSANVLPVDPHSLALAGNIIYVTNCAGDLARITYHQQVSTKAARATIIRARLLPLAGPLLTAVQDGRLYRVRRGTNQILASWGWQAGTVVQQTFTLPAVTITSWGVWGSWLVLGSGQMMASSRHAAGDLTPSRVDQPSTQLTLFDPQSGMLLALPCSAYQHMMVDRWGIVHLVHHHTITIYRLVPPRVAPCDFARSWLHPLHQVQWPHDVQRERIGVCPTGEYVLRRANGELNVYTITGRLQANLAPRVRDFTTLRGPSVAGLSSSYCAYLNDTGLVVVKLDGSLVTLLVYNTTSTYLRGSPLPATAAYLAGYGSTLVVTTSGRDVYALRWGYGAEQSWQPEPGEVGTPLDGIPVAVPDTPPAPHILVQITQYTHPAHVDPDRALIVWRNHVLSEARLGHGTIHLTYLNPESATGVVTLSQDFAPGYGLQALAVYGAYLVALCRGHNSLYIRAQDSSDIYSYPFPGSETAAQCTVDEFGRVYVSIGSRTLSVYQLGT